MRRRPGSTNHAPWFRSKRNRRAIFTPDLGPGAYHFRARLKNIATGATSGFSPILTVRF